MGTTVSSLVQGEEEPGRHGGEDTTTRLNIPQNHRGGGGLELTSQVRKCSDIIEDDDDDVAVLPPPSSQHTDLWKDEGDNDDDDDDSASELPFDPHGVPVGGDLHSAKLGIFKGMVGPAILYLPHGFATAGYIPALTIIAVATAMYLHASQCLLEAWKLQSQRQHVILLQSKGDGVEEEEHDHNDAVHHNNGTLHHHHQHHNPSIESTTTTALHPHTDKQHHAIQQSQQHHHHHAQALSYAGLAKQALGVTGERIVQAGIALMQSGVCLTYLIFVPHNLHTSMTYLTSGAMEHWTPTAWLFIMVVLEIPLSWITDIRRLAITNLLANICIFYGLALCLIFAFTAAATVTVAADTDEQQQSSSPSIKPHHLAPFASQWFLFVGTSVLLFEGSITLLVPLQESLTSVADRKQFPHTYSQVILSIIGFYIFFGLTCWSAFGDNVSVVLTTSLPTGRWATSVQLAYSIAVFLTYPFQNFPALQVATPMIAHELLEHRCGLPKGHVLTHRSVISSVLVVCMAIIALLTMNSLDKVVSLMGSLLGCPIAFCMPPLIHNELVESTPLRQRINRLVAGAGLVAMILASTATILTW